MTKKLIIAAIFTLFTAKTFANDAFPTRPNPDMTPGSTCQSPTSYRYPEHIPYCTRNVSASLKRQIIHTYDETFGFRVERMNRSEFKIDHYVPLCMGGSNQQDNLWPQHQSIYIHTDPLEQRLCEKMASGELTQKDAIDLIKRAKENPQDASDILEAYSH